jgi:hypothetical protein
MNVRREAFFVLGPVLVIVSSLLGEVAAGRDCVTGVLLEAKDLTAAEQAHAKSLARAAGSDVWLLYGFRYGAGAASTVRHTAFEIYLTPDVQRGRLRRGRMLRVDEQRPNDAQQQTRWRTESTERYAQVVEAVARVDAVYERSARMEPPPMRSRQR